MSEEALKELDDTVDRVFKENQAKLPESDRIGKGKFCEVMAEGWTCTKDPHAEGEHIAHGRLGTILKRWK